MTGPEPLAPPRAERRLLRACALLLLAGGLCAIAGWQFRVPLLKGALLGSFVAPNTALMFTLAGLAVLLPWQRVAGRWLARLCAAACLLLGTAIALQYVLGVDLGVDRAFMAHRLADWSVPTPPGRIAFPTSMAFACCGLALLLASAGRKWLADLFAAGVGAVAYVGLMGYLFGVRSLYGQIMAVATAALLCVMTPACFLAGGARPFATFLTAPTFGARLFRRLALVTGVVLPLVGRLALYLRQTDLLTREEAIATMVLAAIAITMPVVLRTARALDAAHAASERAQQALVASERLAATGRMAAAIAHEINNPLAAAVNLAFLIEGDSRLAPETALRVRMLSQELSRVAHITKQTLSFYRTSKEAIDLAPAALAEEILAHLQPEILAKNITVQKLYDPQFRVRAHPMELRQVLSNLLRNAVEAVSAGGTVLLELELAAVDEERGLRITVEDDGPGVPEEIGARLFEPFATTKLQKGTGLGLWITRGIVTRQGGAIRAGRSGRLSGASFSVFLPSREPEREARSGAIA